MVIWNYYDLVFLFDIFLDYFLPPGCFVFPWFTNIFVLVGISERIDLGFFIWWGNIRGDEM